jgi:hypothetical protein
MTPLDLPSGPPRARRRLGGPARAVGLGAVLASVAVGASSPPLRAEPPPVAPEFALLGPLRARDMMAFRLPRLEMVPTESSAAIGEGWSLETELTYVNTFAMSDNVLTYLGRRGGRKPVTRLDAATLLALPGDLFYVDGEFAQFVPTVHYQLDPRLSVFLSWPVLSFGGGIFDSVIEGFHHGLGLGNGNRELVARNEFNVLYRVGRDQVVERGPPAGGLSDPIAGIRYRLLPPASRWDLIAAGAVKIATRSRSALSTGGSDVGIQLALHRALRRQAFYLDLSAVHFGGVLTDRQVDRRGLATFVAAYELGLSRRTSIVAQLYTSPSVFRRAQPVELRQRRYHVLAGLRSRRGPLTWHLSFIENLIHLENTPDVGAQLGISWSFGKL